MGTLMRYDAASGTSVPVLPSQMLPAQAHLVRTTNLSVPDGVGTPTTIVWASASAGDGTTGITYGAGLVGGSWVANYPGIYTISASIQWDSANVTGRRILSIYVDGDQKGLSSISAASLPSFNAQTVQITEFVPVGGVVDIKAAQNSGSAVNIIGDSLRCWANFVRAA